MRIVGGSPFVRLSSLDRYVICWSAALGGFGRYINETAVSAHFTRINSLAACKYSSDTKK